MCVFLYTTPTTKWRESAGREAMNLRSEWPGSAGIVEGRLHFAGPLILEMRSHPKAGGLMVSQIPEKQVILPCAQHVQ